MTKKNLTKSASLFLALFLTACSSGLHFPEDYSYTEADHSIVTLFSVQDKKSNAVKGYLLGSVHDRVGTVEALPASVQEAVRNSDEMVFEIGLRMMVFQKKLKVTGSPYSLGSLFPDGGTKGNPEFFKDCDLRDWESLHASLAIFLVSECRETLHETAALFETGVLEDNLRNYAVSRGLEVGAIETIEDRKKWLESFRASEVKNWIEKAIDDPAEGSFEYGEIFSYAAAIEVLDDIERYSPMLFEYGLVKRNQEWLPRMLERMETNKVFFVFGLAHLPGEKGLIQLLWNNGYRVKAISGAG